MVSHMKTTLNIDETLMKRLRIEAARRGTTMTRPRRGMAAPRPCRTRSPAIGSYRRPCGRVRVWNSGGARVDMANRRRALPAHVRVLSAWSSTPMSCATRSTRTRHSMTAAARACSRLVEDAAPAVPDLEQAAIERVRVAMVPGVYRAPWSIGDAWDFLTSLLASRGFEFLTPTPRHASVLAQTLAELPDVRGNRFHDLHTAVAMRENRCQPDLHPRHRLPSPPTFLTVIDPRR